MKTCKKCQIEQPKDQFGKRSRSSDGLNYWCKSCMKQNTNTWRQDNPQRQADNGRKWVENNQERRRSNQASYYQKNKSRLLILQQKSYHARMKDPLQKIKARCRNRIAQIYHNGRFSKTASSLDMIGCTWDQLYAHLISTALSRYGIWCLYDTYEVDHIVPIMTASSEEEVIKLSHFSNLQLLTPEDHLKKTNEDIKLYKYR